MEYTNSPLVSFTRLSPNNSGLRTHSVDRITPHCVVGQCSVETLGEIFVKPSRNASANYGIGVDGRVGMYCEEKNRSWCSSSNSNDQRAITIECASDNTAPYAFNNTVYNRLIELCVDICKRHGKKKLLWLGSKEASLAYEPAPDEMILTKHNFFAATECPGSWMEARMGDLATKVTSQLQTTIEYKAQVGAYKTIDAADKTDKDLKNKGFNPMVVYLNGYYKVWVGPFTSKADTEAECNKLAKAGYPGCFVTTDVAMAIPDMSIPFNPYMVKVGNNVNIRKGPGTNYAIARICSPGVYTIVEESNGQGSSKWGKLKSGAGWISLDVVKKI